MGAEIRVAAEGHVTRRRVAGVVAEHFCLPQDSTVPMGSHIEM